MPGAHRPPLTTGQTLWGQQLDLDAYVDSVDTTVFSRAEESFVAALHSRGLKAQVIKEGDWFRAIAVEDPQTGQRVIVDLGYDYRSSPPVYIEGIGPVLSLNDILVGKLRALVDRRAERDYFDVDRILQDGRWSPKYLFSLISPVRPEISFEDFQAILSSGHEGDLENYRALGIQGTEIVAMFSRLASASQGGEVFVSAHTRNGVHVNAHWRSRPQQ